MMLRTFTFIFLLLQVVSCQQASFTGGDLVGSETLFEIELVNYAWGFAYQGTVIEKDGSMYAYNPGKDQTPVLSHADGYYADEELHAKYAHQRAFIRRVSPDTLQWLRSLAAAVTPNVFSDTTDARRDAGEVEYSAYIPRKATVKFEKVVLRVSGDFEFYNTSQNAFILATWMKANAVWLP